MMIAPDATEAQREELREELGLNDPLLVRYGAFLLDLCKGDLGTSFKSGAPVMDELINRDYDLTRIKAVFITHYHPDHVTGLIDMVGLAGWYFKKMEFSVYMPSETTKERFLDTRGGLYKREPADRIKMNVINEGPTYDDGNIKVTSFRTMHIENAFGYLIECEGKRIYITGDMHASLDDFIDAEALGHVNAFISECAHFPAESLIQKLKTVNTDKIYVVHVFTLDKYDILREHSGELNAELIFPNDGDEFLI